MNCPRCGSGEIAPAERDYTRDYPFWIVLAVVFFLMAGAFLLFFILQLHPVILILMAVAVISWLLDTGKRRRKKNQTTEYICLSCDHRFKVRKTADD
jgi:Na+/H+ antiporter NhaD/arsenite permease-like protein